MYLSRIRLKPEMSVVQLAELMLDRKGYGLHRIFWGLWGDNKPIVRNFLFREEIALEQGLNTGKRSADPVYYLSSAEQPMQQHPLFDIETKLYQPTLKVGDKLSFKCRVNPVVTRYKKRHDIVMNAQHDWLHQQIALLDCEKPDTQEKRKLKHLLLDFANDQMVNSWQVLIKQGVFNEQADKNLRRSDLLEWALKTVVDQAYQNWWLIKAEKNGFKCISNQHEQVVQAVGYQKHHMPEKGAKASFNSVDLTGELTVTDVELFTKLLVCGVGPAKAFGCGLMMIKRIS